LSKAVIVWANDAAIRTTKRNDAAISHAFTQLLHVLGGESR